MTFLFLISFTKNYTEFLQDFNVDEIFNDIFIQQKFPTWLRFLWLNSTIQSFNLIRIFLDAIIMLTVLTEYRKAWIKVLEICILALLCPKVAYKKFKSNKTSNREVFLISNSAQNGIFPNKRLIKNLSTVTV